MSYEALLHVSRLMISTGISGLLLLWIHCKVMPLPEAIRRLKAFINGGFYG